MPLTTIFTQIGLDEKESILYRILLEGGPSSVRTLAQTSGINRGTVYTLLKTLISKGLVSYYHKNTHQYFVAEDPERLVDIAEARMGQLERAKKQLDQALPELRSHAGTHDAKPVVKYLEGRAGVKAILHDVLTTMARSAHKEYYVYSAADVREHLYTDFPDFAKERIKRKIYVKVIALGSGGDVWGMDERKWLTKIDSKPAYIILYEDSMAMISLDQHKRLHGILLTDKNIVAAQKIIFEQLYSSLT